MPELPEVENVRQELERILPELGTITACRTFREGLRRPFDRRALAALKDEKILEIQRRAKYLIFKTQNYALVSHLGMTGAWRREASPKSLKHDHFEIQFANGQSLIYNDPRRFGSIDTFSKEKLSEFSGFKKLGIEPLLPEFSDSWMFEKTRGVKAPIKSWLMNQEMVVGIGNIYASEILFQAQVKPQRLAGKVHKSECQSICKYTVSILNNAIKSGGSTIRDYKSVNGNSGQFQNSFKVYGRDGENCYRCGQGQKIKLARIGGRSTYFCVKCQR